MNIQILGVLILLIIGGIFLVSNYNTSNEVLGYFCTRIPSATVQNNQFSFEGKNCGIQSADIVSNQYGENGVTIEGVMYRLNLESNCDSVETEIKSQYTISEGASPFQNKNGTVYWCTSFNAGT